jgi:2-keto-4-pentenoate hydratase
MLTRATATSPSASRAASASKTLTSKSESQSTGLRRSNWAAAAFLLSGALFSGVLSGPAIAACPGKALIEGWLSQWERLQPLSKPPLGLSYQDALCGQRKFVEAQADSRGTPVGWKVGLTNAADQQRFGVEVPARGVILAGMLLPDGALLPTGFAALPSVEAGMMVSIKSAEIMKAKTPVEAAAGIDEYFPFIELADATWAANPPADYGALLVGNVGIRYGIFGRGVRLPSDPVTVQALADMTVVLEDGTATPHEAKGAAVMTHPLWSLVWLVQDLAARGETLKKGDLVSLGSFTRPRQPVARRTIRLRYDGLPGVVPTVSVTFQ